MKIGALCIVLAVCVAIGIICGVNRWQTAPSTHSSPTSPQPTQPQAPAPTLMQPERPSQDATQQSPATAPVAPVEQLWLEEQPYLLHRVKTPITLDGSAHPEEWGHAMVIRGFRVPKSLEPAHTLTEARLLWDDECLYVQIYAHDEDIRATLTKRTDQLWNEDVVELFLKPYANKPNMYEFEINPLNTVMALEIPKLPKPSLTAGSQWEPGIESAVQVYGTLNNSADRDEGYRVVLAIPFKNLRFLTARPKAGDGWKFTLARYDYSAYLPKSPEYSASASLKIMNFADWENYTAMIFRE